jgi:hypothetical protein
MASWQSRYEDNPRLMLGVAFGAGLALGLTALRSRQNGFDFGEPDLEVLGGETYAVGAPVSGGRTNGNGTLARARHELGETWSAIALGLVRAASAKAVQSLSERVPGFSEQLEGRYATGRQRDTD